MRIGRLRDRVTLKAPVRTTDDAGGEVVSYPADTAVVWAEVLDHSGREYLASREAHAETTAKIRIRYRADVDVDWRVVFDPGGGARVRTYNIVHIADFASRQREQQLLCEEIR
jgi:SPP1 family predicted phage head-tail adaptor